MNMGNELKKLGLKAAYNYLDKDPETNLPKLMEWVDKFVKEGVLVQQRRIFREIIDQKSGNWYQLLVSLWNDIDGGVRKTLFENFLINADALAQSEVMIIDVNQPHMNFETIDKIVQREQNKGTFVFMFIGGNSLDKSEEIIAICNKYSECEFIAVTDGYNMGEEFSLQILRVKNLIPLVKVEPENDEKAEAALKIMEKNKLLYGVYVDYNKADENKYAKEEFYDWAIEEGAKIAFFSSNLPEEEDHVYQKLKKYRETKQLFTINFYKDSLAEYFKKLN